MPRLLPLLLLIILLAPQRLSAASWSALLQRADSLMRAARYEQAEEACTQALAILQAHPRPAATLEALAARAKCRKMTGRYSQALADYDAALALCRENKLLQKNLPLITLNKSDLLITTAQYQQAADELLPLQLPDSSQALVQRRLNNLALALAQTDKPQQATALLNHLIATATDSTTLATAHQNQAYITWQQGNPQAAADHFTKALQLFPTAKERARAMTLANRAVALAEAGNTTQATHDITQALAWMQKNLGTSHPDYLIALRKKYEILLRANSPTQATATAQAYLQAQRQFIMREFPALTSQQRLNYWKMLRPQTAEIFSLESAAPPSLLYNTALFRRAITLLPTTATPAITRRDATTTAADITRSLKKDECAIEFTAYRHLITADTTYAALILLPTKKEPTLIKLFTARELSAITVNGKSPLQATLSDDPADKDSLYASQALATLVWEKIFSHLPQKTTKIYFAPDALFHTLAIEYLPHPQLPQKELHRLTTTARLTHRLTATTTATAAAPPLIIGGLDYTTAPPAATSGTPATAQAPSHEAADILLRAQPQGTWFQPLPYAAREAQAIDTLIAHATLARTMPEESVSQALQTHPTIHLATHGYTLLPDQQPTSPLMRDSLTEDRSLLASGIALTGANNAWKNPQAHDGILSAKEISLLNLQNLRLTVLSACQTALGEPTDEGPAGIVRGLKKAGAQTIIATLWSVNDQSTMLFMQALYKNLAQGLTTHQAFNRARQQLQAHTLTTTHRRRYNPAIQASRPAKLPTPITTHPYARPAYADPYILIDDI